MSAPRSLNVSFPLPFVLISCPNPHTNASLEDSVSSSRAKDDLSPCRDRPPPPMVTAPDLKSARALGVLADLLFEYREFVRTRPKTSCATGRSRGRQAQMTAHSPSTTVSIQGMVIKTALCFSNGPVGRLVTGASGSRNTPVKSASSPPALSLNKKINRIPLMTDTLGSFALPSVS